MQCTNPSPHIGRKLSIVHISSTVRTPPTAVQYNVLYSFSVLTDRSRTAVETPEAIPELGAIAAKMAKTLVRKSDDLKRRRAPSKIQASWPGAGGLNERWGGARRVGRHHHSWRSAGRHAERAHAQAKEEAHRPRAPGGARQTGLCCRPSPRARPPAPILLRRRGCGVDAVAEAERAGQGRAERGEAHSSPALGTELR